MAPFVSLLCNIQTNNKGSINKLMWHIPQRFQLYIRHWQVLYYAYCSRRHLYTYGSSSNAQRWACWSSSFRQLHNDDTKQVAFDVDVGDANADDEEDDGCDIILWYADQLKQTTRKAGQTRKCNKAITLTYTALHQCGLLQNYKVAHDFILLLL